MTLLDRSPDQSLTLSPLRLVLVALVVLNPGLGVGEPATEDNSYTWSLRGGPEYFRWQELDQAGSQLVQEKGPRLALGAAYDNLTRRNSGMLLGGEVWIYGGEVDYDGETIETGQPVNSQTRYFGGRLEGSAGSRFSTVLSEQVLLDLIASVGAEHWLRSIQDSNLANGIKVSGLDEYYTIVYGKLGLAPVWRRNGGQVRLEGGIKYPLYARETVDTSSIGFRDDAELEPEGRVSAYAGATADLHYGSNGTLFLHGYYEGYRFGDSDPDVIQRNDGVFVSVFQPRIRSDSFGLQLGWRY